MAAPNIKFDVISLDEDMQSGEVISLGDNKPYEPPSQDIQAPIIRTFDQSNPSPTMQPMQSGKIWHVTYYRPYFDVDTFQVLNRIKKALLPIRSESFFDNEQPDLYGPFWLATTLIFVINLVSSVESYILDTDTWSDRAANLVIAASLIYSLLALVPFLCYCILSQSGSTMGLIELISLYGYSLIPFVGTSLLCLVPMEWFRWVIMFVGAIWSGVLLVRNLWKEVESLVPARKYILAGVIAMGHLAIVLFANLVFFSENISNIVDE